MLIFISIVSQPSIEGNSVFFSLFHSISAFCNAGFSTFSNSREDSVKYNYFLQLIICWLIITGGIGYTVMINHYYILRNTVLKVLSKFKSLGIHIASIPAKSTINSRIVIRTTLILLFSRNCLFYDR
ncbi:MAG: hypothetical protein IPF52_10565 [Saprospiraceae bacterium]|nr:hypothetical protein [Saprospiraceae bacterium]